MRGESRRIKERPAGAGGGARRIGRGASAFSRSYSTPKRSACQAPANLFRRWLSRARACAARDLAADHARASGDLETFHRLHRRGLRHQVLQVALETFLGG